MKTPEFDDVDLGKVPLKPIQTEPRCNSSVLSTNCTPAQQREDLMNTKLLVGVVIASALLLPVASHAQSGAAPGVTTGLASGAGSGAFAGGIPDKLRPHFRNYVMDLHIPSYRLEREVRLGDDLPPSGVTYYEVPRAFGVTDYRYTIVNDRMVLVDPSTHRIVQVIE